MAIDFRLLNSSSSDHPEQNSDNGNNEKDMNNASGMESHVANGPKNKQYYGNGIK
jgi:hypothetical protein